MQKSKAKPASCLLRLRAEKEVNREAWKRPEMFVAMFRSRDFSDEDSY